MLNFLFHWIICLDFIYIYIYIYIGFIDKFSCALVLIILFLQERIVKVIALMLSLQPDAHQPFLIISTSTALYSWDHEFLRLAPSLYVVVYNGNKDMRKFIRTLEFYEDSGCLLFQVLITSPEVIMTVNLYSLLQCIALKNCTRHQEWQVVLRISSPIS